MRPEIIPYQEGQWIKMYSSSRSGVHIGLIIDIRFIHDRNIIGIWAEEGTAVHWYSMHWQMYSISEHDALERISPDVVREYHKLGTINGILMRYKLETFDRGAPQISLK